MKINSQASLNDLRIRAEPISNMQMRDIPFLAESYLEFNAQDLEFGFNESRRDRILRTFVRNAYYYHLNEIYSTLKNEYTDWDKPVQNPLSVRDATLEVCLVNTRLSARNIIFKLRVMVGILYISNLYRIIYNNTMKQVKSYW